MDEKKKARRNAALASKRVQLREELWPKLKEGDLWDRKRCKGFTTIPRTMPLFMKIMDAMSKNKPVSSVYLALWSVAFDDHVVDLADKEKLAFHAGFTGQRNVGALRERLAILKKLGFIRLAPGTHGDMSHALIMNPYKVVGEHRKKHTAELTEALYNAVVARANEIGAKDMGETMKPNAEG